MFALGSSPKEPSSLRQKLEELLKLMLLIWCKENQAIKLISGKTNADTDKTVILERKSGPYGFRLHGSRPAVVSAIESDTPAETSGLEVGDVIITINGIDVLDKNHSEIIEVAKSSGDSLVFEVFKACAILNPVGEPICFGYLWKLGGYASGLPSDTWLRRWFTLKTDNCLYFYKTDSDTQPVGAVMLLNYEAVRVNGNDHETFPFDLRKHNSPTLHLAADTEEAAFRWLSALHEAITKCGKIDSWVEKIKLNQLMAPIAISDPHCFGYLTKSEDNSLDRRYCVLKDAVLYFYNDVNSSSSFGIACLHGCRVEESDDVEFGFMVTSDDVKRKSFHFVTESKEDKHQWIAALEYSIGQCQWGQIDL